MSSVAMSAPVEEPCPKCTAGAPAHDPAKCIGHVGEEDGTVRPCRNRPRKGQRVCGSHGGRSPQAKKAAARRLALGEALAELERLGRPIEIDPAEAMLEMVYEAAGNVAVYRQLVQRLRVNDVDAGVGAIEGEVENKRGEPPVPGIDDIDRSELGASIASRVDPANWKAAPHVWVTMYNDERELLVKWAKACRDAGVDERRVQLAEDRGAQIAAVLTAAVGALFELLEDRLILIPEEQVMGVLERIRVEQVPGVLRQAITTTLTGEAG